MCVLVTQSRPTLCDPMNYNPPGSSVHGILWAAIRVRFTSVSQLCLTLSDPMDYSTPAFPSSPTPGAYSNSSPLSQWCYPTISSFVVHFSSGLQSFPTSWSFQMSQFFASGSQIIRVSALTSVLLMNIQDLFPLGLTGLISLQSRDSQESSPTPQFKGISFLYRWSAFFIVQLSHPYMTTGKTIALTRQTFISNVSPF